MLTETGLLGLTAFVYLLYSVLKLILRRLRETDDPYYKGLIMGFTAGFVGLVVHSLGTNTFILVRIMEPFWFFVGIIAVLPTIEAGRPAVPAEAAGQRAQISLLSPAAASRRRLILPPVPGKGTPT